MQTGQGPWRSLAKPGPAEPRSSAAAAVAAATLAQEPGAFKGTPQTRQGGCVCPQWGSWTAGHLRRRPRAQDRQWPCPGGCDASHSIPPGNGLEPQACALFHQVLSSQETQLSTRGCPAGPAHAEAQQSPGFRLPAACLPSLPRAHLTAAARAPGGRATRRRLLGTPGPVEVPQTGGKDVGGFVFATAEREAVWAQPSSSTQAVALPLGARLSHPLPVWDSPAAPS